jgi:hypothetical protein
MLLAISTDVKPKKNPKTQKPKNPKTAKKQKSKAFPV